MYYIKYSKQLLNDSHIERKKPGRMLKRTCGWIQS